MPKINLKKIYSSNLVRNSFVYIVSDGINKVIPFLILPLITYYLTPADYGIITNFNVLVQLLSLVCFQTFQGSLSVLFFRLKKEQIQKYASNLIILTTVISIFFVLILFIFNKWINNLLELPFDFQLLTLVIVWFSALSNVNLVLWRCEEKPIPFGAYQISQSLINLLTTVVFVIILLLGWKGRVYSYVFSVIMFGIISSYILYRRNYLTFSFSKLYIKHILLFGIPLLPHALSFWLKSGADKIIITQLCGLVENGLFSTAITWGGIMTLFLTALNNAYLPFLYKKLNLVDNIHTEIKEKEKEKMKLVRFTYAMLLLLFLISALSYGVAYFFIKTVYAFSYWESVKYLPWIMLAQFFQGGYKLYVNYIFYKSKTKKLGVITFSISILQIGLTYLFIVLYGPIGAGISQLIGAILIFIFVAWYAIRLTDLPWWSFSKIFKSNGTV